MTLPGPHNKPAPPGWPRPKADPDGSNMQKQASIEHLERSPGAPGPLAHTVGIVHYPVIT